MGIVIRCLVKTLLLLELTQFFVFNILNIPPFFGVIKDILLCLICLSSISGIRALKLSSASLVVFGFMLVFYILKLSYGWNEKAYFMPRILLWYFLLKVLDIGVNKSDFRSWLRMIVYLSIFASVIVTLLDMSDWLVSIGYPSSVWDEGKLNHSWYSSNGNSIRFGGFMVSPVAFGLFLLWYLLMFKDSFTNLEWLIVVFGIVGTQSRLIILVMTIFFVRTLPRRYKAFAYASISLGVMILLSLYYDDLLLDRSARGHYSSFLYGLSLMTDLPLLGYDLGYFGSFVGSGLLSGNVIESGLLLLFIEHGWFIGMILLVYFVREMIVGNSRVYIMAVLLISLFLPVFQYLSVLLLPALIDES